MSEVGPARNNGGADDLVAQRLRKLEELRSRGIEPYPTTFQRTVAAGEAVAEYDRLAGQDVSVAGRIVSRRIMGRVSFCHIQDGTGRVQLFLKEDALGPEEYAAFRDLYDIGDIVGARGTLMKTRAGEVSVQACRLVMLAKSLRPLPEKWHGLTDVEQRYRRRYLDLIVNPEVRRIFQTRSATVSAIRRFLEARGFIEIETPVLQPLYGGATARPFKTHHHALEREMFLRIATELYLKRAVVGGFDKVFEIGRVFRNEGIDTTHNPEFTVLESYEAYASYLDVMAMVEELIPWIAHEVLGTTGISYQGQSIDLRPPWQRVTLREAILHCTGVDVEAAADRDDLYRQVAHLGLEIQPTSPRGKIIDELLSARVEHTLIQPTFVTDYPVELSPLAKRKPGQPNLVERFEAYVGGLEIANAFSELNDALDQRTRFAQQLEARAAGDEEAHLFDEDFVEALEHGMPPTGGLGIGVDRLVMLLTDQRSIREVILFPHLRSVG
ncbi:MAG TPA: lysine--tRNA ligase [Chloroflexota bacterium]|nr:lysine--tRNA ligase [Chloroflexota bacterium]